MKKTRIIAAVLSAITVFSAAGMSLSTASAAEVHGVKPSHVRTLEEKNTSTESGKSASEIAKHIATKVFKKVLKKVGKTGMPASLVCDGLSFLFDLSDYLDGKTTVNPDAEKLMNAINDVSNKMDQYHDEEMRKLILINSNIDSQKFREQIDSIVLDYIHANKKIGEQSCNIKTSGSRVIDKKWRLKYMISDTTFSNNHAEYGAAVDALYAEDGSYVRNCRFTENTADKAAGALYCVSGVSRCVFENNKAGTDGGACGGWTEVSDSTFTGNTAGADGGAVWTQRNVINCTFKNNKAGGEGGAVFVQPRLQTISSCTFENNRASKGGALTFALDGSKAVNCTFKNNSADYDGGALFIRSNEDGAVSRCTFEGNTAGADGGAICAGCHAKLMADNTTIINNRAGGKGGGIYCSAGAFKAADTYLRSTVIIRDNSGDNAYLVSDSGKKALLYTREDFDRSGSAVYVSSSSRSDIAVVDLDSKSHQDAFRADYGRRIYRGTMYNGTLYLDDM